MSEGKNISSVPKVTDVSHLLALEPDGSLGKIAGSKFPRFIAVEDSVAQKATIELTDFLNQFVVGKAPGTLILENQYADANKRTLKIGSLSFSLQKYDVMILRSVRNTLTTDWGNWNFMLIPAREGKMLFVNVYTGATSTEYFYNVRDVMGNVVVETTTVPIGGG